MLHTCQLMWTMMKAGLPLGTANKSFWPICFDTFELSTSQNHGIQSMRC